MSTNLCALTVSSLENILGIQCRTLSEQSHRTPLSHGMRKCKRAFRKLWYPILQMLHSLKDGPQAAHCKTIIEIWTALGGLVGLHEENEAMSHRYFMDRVQEEFPRGRTKRCHYIFCVCSDDGHAPHSMRTCKGCKQAYYCGAECQKFDWEDMHREECHVWMMDREVPEDGDASDIDQRVTLE
ncbi:hypothetical protein K474DRAFT_1499419 [Panus rudis PR-1116 ss-1]|nr:hypothetical protein K474DRAFT_1499419 [Panus rudis PR-1116 ss-1]